MAERPVLQKKNHSERGAERTPLVVFSAIAVLLAVLVIPAYMAKRQQEAEIRLKAQLRSFHSANEAYRLRHAAEGYAADLAGLVQNPEKIRYLGESWLDGKIEGYRLDYRVSEEKPRHTYALMAYPAGGIAAVHTKPFCVDLRGILHTESAAPDSLPLTAQTAGCEGGIEVV